MTQSLEHHRRVTGVCTARLMAYGMCQRLGLKHTSTAIALGVMLGALARSPAASAADDPKVKASTSQEQSFNPPIAPASDRGDEGDPVVPRARRA